MNGAEEVAGSNPSRFKSNGIIDPITVPHSTTPKTEKPIVAPINTKCGPYISVKTPHADTRAKPITPRTNPKSKPVVISLRIIFHQSFIVTSPSAKARIISVDA